MGSLFGGVVQIQSMKVCTLSALPFVLVDVVGEMDHFHIISCIAASEESLMDPMGQTYPHYHSGYWIISSVTPSFVLFPTKEKPKIVM